MCQRVVLVQPLLGGGGRLDVPADEVLAERLGDLLGEHRLARAGLALHKKRALEGDRGVDRDHQVLGGDVGFGSAEQHRAGAPLTALAAPPLAGTPPRSSGAGARRGRGVLL
jgi:hypothetical protein